MEEDSLTEEQVAEFREAFLMLCKEKKGPLTVRRLGRVMRLLGLNPTDRDLHDMIDEIDPKGKGILDYAEFLRVMRRRTLDAETTEQLQEAFRVLDKDGDGYLTVGELRQAMTTRGDRMSQEEVEDMMRQLDLQGHGRVSCEDFVKIVTS
ncbi:calmodulin-like [Babylonia areolata]|uniref:calmodulin-like n=1 Tax=Babylonia areolata TaxID=304850 RepID=UPI003FD4A179